MAAIRMIAQTRDAAMHAATRAARDMEGCLQVEDFQGIERADSFLHLELWSSPAAWDAAWAARSELLSSASSDAEFYKQACFTPTGPAWVAQDADQRADSIRWAADGAIRILIQVAADVEAPAGPFIENSEQTRTEPGCRAFEYFRSLDFPENIALIESWATPEIYDEHWRRRLAENAPLPPPPPPRRYGETSFEWYLERSYILDGQCWVAADPSQRMATVLW